MPKTDTSYLLYDGIIADAGNETDLVNKANADGQEDWETTDEPDFTQGVYVGDGIIIYPDKETADRLGRIFAQ